ncbi:HlyD family secretion protein [Neorhizobium galegae]|uniref:efflux RND transporter periplasmic adaptor subunit n=1 Tax=Neorhizobium galegae TaxID=399 RepID=UPI001FD8C072|nr:efflux RND transporter periplasmic adaptor subunit [Neorhizobium galegae]MBP2548728.1 HlyD family secretion protein [Neorhizobium galegae]
MTRPMTPIAALTTAALLWTTPYVPHARAEEPAAPVATRAALPAIVVTEAVARPLVDSVVASGTIRAVQEIYVQPLVDGLSIKTLGADVGDRVKAGDVMATLNEDALLLQKSQQQANKVKAEAALAQYQAQVIEAQANAEDAVRQRNRAETLSRNGTVSASQVEQLTASAAAAEARLNAARQAVSVGEADIKVVAAQIDDIDLRLERTAVKAPVDGVVSVRNAKVGAIAAGTSSPLFTLIREGRIELVADVAESDVRRIKSGQTARIAVNGGSDTLSGTVRLVAPTVDPVTRLGAVHITVDENSGAKAGMYGTAEIIITETTALTLPQSAVNTDRHGSIARKVEDNVVKQVTIETGIQSKGFVEIRSGLSEGDVVVAKAGAFVRDGDRITPVRAAPVASNQGLTR